MKMVIRGLSTKAWRLAAVAAMINLGFVIACFDVSPSECKEAAEEAGLPDSVIEQLRNPGDLNPVERAALNRSLH